MVSFLGRLFISTCAGILRGRAGRRPTGSQPFDARSQVRILCLTRAETIEMICILPLLHALRRHFPAAYLVVAGDPLGAPIAQACPAVDEVIILDPGWIPWQAALKNAARLQDYDWVIAVKGGFARRLARLGRLTNGTVRIGFERRTSRPSVYFTDPVEPVVPAQEEHQADTLLRLLKPLGLVKPTGLTLDLTLCVPDGAREFAAAILSHPPFASSRRFMLINLSGAAPVKFREQDFIALASRLMATTDWGIGLVAALRDQQKASEIAMCMASKRIASIDTPGPLELAALLESAAFLLTPEGDAAHLAAAVRTPALVLWSKGAFGKWHSRGRKHAFVHAEPGENTIPLERVWSALQPFLDLKIDRIEDRLEDLTEPPSDGDVLT